MSRWIKRLVMDLVHLAIIIAAFWFGYTIGDTSGAYRGHNECVADTVFPTQSDMEKFSRYFE